MSRRIGLYPRVRVEGGGSGVLSHAGAVLSAETVRKVGLDTAISAASAPWRKPRTVHDPGKVLLARSRRLWAGTAWPMSPCCGPSPTCSAGWRPNPTVSRLVDVLAAAGPKALTGAQECER